MSRLIFSLMLLCSTIQATSMPATNADNVTAAQNPGGQPNGNAADEKRPTNPTLQKIWDLINRVKTQGSQLNATLVDMSNKIALDNNSKDSSVIIKLDNLMKELTNWTNSIKGIQTQDRASKAFIDEIRALDREIFAAIRQAEEQFRKNKVAYNDVSQSIQSKQTTIAELVEISRGRGEVSIQLSQELASFDERLNNAETSSKALQDDIDHLNSIIASTNDEIKSKETAIQSNNKTIARITSDIARQQKERNQVSEQLKTLRASLSKCQEEFNKNSNALFAKRNDLGILAKNLLAAKSEEANLKTSIANRQSAIVELNVKSSPSEIEQQRGALSLIRESISLLKNTLKEVEQRTEQARTAFNLRADTLKKLTEDHRIAVREANQMEAQIAEIQQGATDLAQQKIEQDKAIEKAEATFKKTQQQLRDLKVQQVTNEATRISVTNEFNDRRKELERISGEINKVENEINDRAKSITRDHEALKSNNTSEVNRYDNAAFSFDSKIATLNISLKSLGERLNAFKQGIQQIKDRNAEAMAQRQGITNALSLRPQSQQAD